MYSRMLWSYKKGCHTEIYIYTLLINTICTLGCYDPIRKVVTLRDGCFADHHCEHLPNTICTLGKT